MSLIEIRDLSKKFGNNVVLDHVDLDIEKGDVVAIIGPSGTGKSTLLRCLNLLEKPESGTVTIKGETFDLTTKSSKDRLRLRQYTEMVFQQFNLFRQKSALENVMEGALIVKKKSKEEAQEIAVQNLEKVGMQDKLNHYPRHLSGGQQQRVAIAREGNTILLVTHEMNFVRHVANRVIFLENGKIVADGTAEEIFEHPTNQRLKEFLININLLDGAEYMI